MKKRMFIIFLVIFAIGGLLVIYWKMRERNRNHYITSFNICNRLTVEKFEVSSFSNLYADYLTDSLNFRKFIGTYHYYEDILYDCRGDSVLIRKVNNDESQPILIESKSYNIALLKQQQNYK